ncbi:MAG: flagellar biosynthesis repressor FlbT [Beijerinckiaceae bacterium]|nr:flagellar biosynthesis repressor FlbT [Beijerinckiaceae bacterium]
MQLSLRSGEKLYLNGAVIKVDRKVSIELMNDVTFLLEAHVLTPENTTTPLRQLYFTIQVMLMDPSCKAEPQAEQMLDVLMQSFQIAEILKGLAKVRDLLAVKRRFEALKTSRKMYPIEAEIFAPERQRMTLPAA